MKPFNLSYGLLMLVSLLFLSSCITRSKKNEKSINLSGNWRFSMDEMDQGITQNWFHDTLKDEIKLPGSMTSNGKGNEVDINTPWTGGIVDSSWFKKEEYAKYREKGNIKIPFWLQPERYYKGAAWYQKDIEVSNDDFLSGAELFIERSHWETKVWINDQELGIRNSLSVPHRYDLGSLVKSGKYRLTIRVDNRVKDTNVGPNSHSISDHTQTNWNGMIGELSIKPLLHRRLTDLQLYPNVEEKKVLTKLTVFNGGNETQALVNLVVLRKENGEKLKSIEQQISLIKGSNTIEIEYPMGDTIALWDEFHPNLYQMEVEMEVTGQKSDYKQVVFGMRNFSTQGTQLLLNNKPVFLRGTLESGIFPKTGYPPTDIASWTRIFSICKEYGLNHVRFHSWCPPKAAFEAADSLGFYLQVESSSWANQGATLGDGDPIDQFIYDESERIVKEYGNHPSFSLMAYGNEPAGKNQVQFLTQFVEFWKSKDNRRLYTTAAGWPAVPENDFNNIPEPRIQGWGEGLNSIINKQKPRTDFDWREDIKNFRIPTISHEIGQWCVYPDFKEIEKYTGVLKAKNFEIFQEKLQENGMGDLAEDFLMASGKLQALCYKADIEAALRTPKFGGFQLLDLHDFPGQGTALVGVLNPFWESKGYIDGKAFSQFTNSTVPLARFPKMIYLNDENLHVPIEVAHYGEAPLNNSIARWEVLDSKGGKVLASGSLNQKDIPLGNNYSLGTVDMRLSVIEKPSQLTLKVTLNEFSNQWDFFVYPRDLPTFPKEIYTTQQLDRQAKNLLATGGTVLLTLKKGSLKAEKGGDIAHGFSSIFWNTAWTASQPPVTLGVLCDPTHPALTFFPTDYYSNWQWWDSMTHSNVLRLDEISKELKPIVRVIDDWVTARPLGLLVECKVGNGKLLLSGIDFITDIENRPEAQQLLYSLKKYMGTDQFNPLVRVDEQTIADLIY